VWLYQKTIGASKFIFLQWENNDFKFLVDHVGHCEPVNIVNIVLDA
jgi:hypothetical protein